MPSTCASLNTETYKLIASSARPHCLPTNIRVGVIVCLIGLSALNINCHDNPYLSCIHPYLSANGYGPSGAFEKFFNIVIGYVARPIYAYHVVSTTTK